MDSCVECSNRKRQNIWDTKSVYFISKSTSRNKITSFKLQEFFFAPFRTLWTFKRLIQNVLCFYWHNCLNIFQMDVWKTSLLLIVFFEHIPCIHIRSIGRRFDIFCTLWTSDGRQNNVVLFQKIPVNTRRYLDVVFVCGRQMDVKTTLCAYWVIDVFKMY